MSALVCVVCGDVRQVADDLRVGNVPVLEWFERRGRRCRLCFIKPWLQPPPDDDASIQSRFERFHAANPWMYQKLVDRARELVKAGQQHLGMRMLWEVARFERLREVSDPDSEYKLNDHYPSRYVRLIQATCPDLADRFETRKIRTD